MFKGQGSKSSKSLEYFILIKKTKKNKYFKGN